MIHLLKNSYVCDRSDIYETVICHNGMKFGTFLSYDVVKDILLSFEQLINDIGHDTYTTYTYEADSHANDNCAIEITLDYHPYKYEYGEEQSLLKGTVFFEYMVSVYNEKMEEYDIVNEIAFTCNLCDFIHSCDLL